MRKIVSYHVNHTALVIKIFHYAVIPYHFLLSPEKKRANTKIPLRSANYFYVCALGDRMNSLNKKKKITII